MQNVIYHPDSQEINVAGVAGFDGVVMLIVHESHPPIMVFNDGHREFMPLPEGEQ